MSGFSQELRLDICRQDCSGEQTVEYTCTFRGGGIQWILEPLIPTSPDDPNAIRLVFSNDVGSTESVGNIFAILDSQIPIISRLRITSNSSLNTGTVVCRTTGGADSVATYERNTYGKLIN